MKRRQIVKWLMLIAITLMATVVRGDLISHQYHGEQLTLILTDWPKRLCFTVLLVFAAVLIEVFLCRKCKSGECRFVVRVLLITLTIMVTLPFILQGMRFKCKKCGSTFTELTGEDPTLRMGAAGGKGHYRGDCPKCSGWSWEDSHPRRDVDAVKDIDAVKKFEKFSTTFDDNR